MNEGTPKKRPSKRDPEVIAAVALKLASLADEWGDLTGSDYAIEDIVHALTTALKGSSSWDGYDLARRVHDWNPDAQLVEILDCASSFAYKILDRLIEVWAHDYKPRFALGDRIKFSLASSFGASVHEGLISRVNLRRGDYTIYSEELGHVKEGIGSHGIVIDWEVLERDPVTTLL